MSDADQEKMFATSFYAGWSRISPSGKYVLVSVLDMLMVLDSQDGHILSKLSLGYDSRTNDVFALDLGDGFRFQRLKKLEFLEDDSIVALTESNTVFVWEGQSGKFKERIRTVLPSEWISEQISTATSMGYFHNLKNGDVLQISFKDMHVLPITRSSRVILIKSQEASANKKIAVVVSEEPEIIQWGEGPIYVPYSVGIWSITDLKKLSEIKDEYPIQAVAFSHNGAYVAVGNSIGTIRIYDASSGEEKARVQRSEGVRSLAFVDNDMYILSTTGPSRTYPPTGGADMIQFDKWKTEDLRRAGCRSIESEYLSFGCSGEHR